MRFASIFQNTEWASCIHCFPTLF